MIDQNEPVLQSRTTSQSSVPPSSAQSGLLQVGDVLDGRYRILGSLGSGGMGCVYRAEHIAIRRAVAIKLLHTEMEGVEEVQRRFEREAFATGRVDHPNCVQVSDFGQLDDGTLYMVLELLDGTLLLDLLTEQKRLPWRRALHIARHILGALAHAHEAGIVHRDIKPENVILVEQGEDPDFAKILDFGIAKVFDGLADRAAAPQLTQVGVTVGTPTYMSPEQALGQPVDGRADLYALSVMLFEMLTGVPPFEAADLFGLLTMHTTAAAPRIAELVPEVCVPAELEVLIQDGLAKKPEDRIPSAREAIARVDAILGADPGAVAPSRAGASRSRRFPVRRSARPWLLVLAVVVPLFVLASVPFGSSAPSYLPRSWLSPAEDPSQEAERAAELLAQGHPREASQYLRQRRQAIQDAPFAQLMLGHAEASAHRQPEALRAYQRAVSLQAALSKDKLLRANLELALDDQRPATLQAAFELLASLIEEADDRWARATLTEMASSGPSPQVRQRAMSEAEALGLGDDIDRLQSFTLDLEQGESCVERRAAVARLRALGDKRAIDALQNAKQRMRKHGLGRKTRNTNACLVKQAEEAIRYLQSL
jgi:serine/threonine protein kinase